jgi:hypothetical protein
MATGFRKRHARSCRSRNGGNCNCRPSFEAWVWEQPRAAKDSPHVPDRGGAAKAPSVMAKFPRAIGLIPCHHAAYTLPVAPGLSPMNRVFNLIPKRAEARHAEQLRDTFVDSGVSAALVAIDHQVLYGRRGTGKTHALRYLETVVQSRGDIAIYADLRTVGSPGGLFQGDNVPTTERAARLLVDLLGQLHDAVLQAAIEDPELVAAAGFVSKIDALLEAITNVRVVGDVEVSKEGEEKRRRVLRETRRGTEQISLNFSDVARALRELADALSTRRVWLLLDEWSSIPQEMQPYLAEFLVRCVLPLQQFTVKIAAIERQSNFRAKQPDGSTIGIELESNSYVPACRTPRPTSIRKTPLRGS